MKIPVISVEQPIGEFFIASFPADLLVARTFVRPREIYTDDSRSGIQRNLSKPRINEIAYYTKDPDAVFPTPIIINVKQDFDGNAHVKGGFLQFNEQEFRAEIVDGQHRIEGLKVSGQSGKFQLPVVVIFDLTEEEKAYIFSTINGNQRRVDPSLIYDLFDVSTHRSPFRTAHEIARALANDVKSPWYGRLKMLGRKTAPNQSISQGKLSQQ